MRTTMSRAALAAVALSIAAATPAVAAPNTNTSEKLREAVTVQGVKSHLQALQSIADLAGGNRFAGLPGHDASARYVIDRLREAGYEPTIFPFTYDAFYERTPSMFSAGGTSYVNGVDFRVLSYSGSGDATGPLARPAGDSRGCYASDFAGFPAGAVALVQRGTPAGFPGGSCTFRIKLENAQAAGAVAAVVFNNVPGVINGTLGATGLSAIPGIGITQALGQSLQAGTPARVRTNTESQPLETYNVLAETPGGDPSNVVMAGAHLDSVAAGPGINDNGTGSAAILETAIQMAKVTPRNKVRFAWWSAEESGLIGATRYVAALPQAEGDKIAAYLNFDMVGSPNPVRFVYDGDGSADGGASIPALCDERCRSGSKTIESLFTGYFSEVAGLPTEPTPFNGRSDYGPFINADIPAGGLFTGAEGIKTAAQAALFGGQAGVAYDPCYHAGCDTIDNVDDAVLDQNSDAVAHVTLTLAQSTATLNGLKGKGNFKRPAQSDEAAGGTGGGGGDEHDHEDEEA